MLKKTRLRKVGSKLKMGTIFLKLLKLIEKTKGSPVIVKILVYLEA